MKPSAQSDLSTDTKKDLLKKMIWVRLVQEAIIAEYPKQQMRCPVHLCIGQEANSVGVSQNLRPDDLVFGGHRYHGPYLARGGNLDRMISEFYGKENGCTSGFGGSMHLIDRSVGVEGAVPILGSSMSIAVGAALSVQLRKQDRLVVAFIGDAIPEEGIFHESMNMASVKNLPFLVYCENNGLSTMTSLQTRQPNRPLTDVAKAHGIRSWNADGNDVESVVQISAEAAAYVRTEGKPAFVEAKTFRWREHCGPSYDFDLGFRSETEVRSYETSCPIAKWQKKLLDEALVSEQEIVGWRSEMKERVDASMAQAQKAAFPDPERTFRSVFDSAQVALF